MVLKYKIFFKSSGKCCNLARIIFIHNSVAANPRILVCPLDWGMGHATRCVPVINELILQGAEVIIGAANRPQAFLRSEFPGLLHIDFPGHKVSYAAGGGGLALHMMKQAPSILEWIKKENRMLDSLIRDHHIQGVISDNRFGLYSEKIPAIYMTHQVFIKAGPSMIMLEPALARLHLKYIKRYSECWIPDVEGAEGLSGELSHLKPLPANFYFIGPLSRFEDCHEELTHPEETIDIVVILSGPEPQRSELERKILQEIGDTNLNTTVVAGTPEIEPSPEVNGNLSIYPHLPTNALYKVLQQAKMVISRPGYSTLMDLAVSGKKALLIPTPGQTEQEYLGKSLMDRGVYACMSQADFKLEQGLQMALKYSGIQIQRDKSLLAARVSAMLSGI